MSIDKPKRIVKHGCYTVSNRDLRIRDRNGRLMNGNHEVFVVSKSSKKGFVKVKTITSVENVDGGFIRPNIISDIKKGRIVPIPIKEINSKKLSGVHRKPIWVHKSKLKKSNYRFKYPTKYNNVINVDKR